MPDVEIVRRGLEKVMKDAVVDRVTINRVNLRLPFPEDFVKRLAGRRVVALRRRAKYILIEFDDQTTLLIHLGMTGSFRVEDQSSARQISSGYYYEHEIDRKHDHVRLDIGEEISIIYNDPRRFGFMTLIAVDEIDEYPVLAGIGIEPLADAFDGASLARLMTGKRTSLKVALLDQSLIAGLGNIFACEAMHRAGLSPRRTAGSLAKVDGTPTLRAERLATAIRSVLQEAIDAGSTYIKDARHDNSASGDSSSGFRVYDRERKPCLTPACTGVIKRVVQGGRSSFFCSVCQR